MKTRLLSLLLPLAAIAQAPQIPDPITYSIPVNTKIFGPSGTRTWGVTYTGYYPENGDTFDVLQRIASENHENGKLFKREMWFQGKLHGKSSEWHKNGLLKSVDIYNMGLLDGLCQAWNGKGELLRSSQFKMGSGEDKYYDDSGKIILHETWFNGKLDGLRIECWAESVFFGYFKNNFCIKSLKFDLKFKTLSSYTNRNSEGKIFGPAIEYMHDGKIKAEWYCEGKVVSSDLYKVKAKEDPTMFPYESDAFKILKKMEKENLHLLNEYLSIPLVKIPLEFDAKGNPVLK